MTTPQERFRALAHFIELLDLALRDELLPAHLRDPAAFLRRKFPDVAALAGLISSSQQGLSAEMAVTLHQAVLWLDELGRSKPLSPELQAWWRWMGRHFPTAGDVAEQREHAKHPPSFLRPPISAWLQAP
jgi:hypothetical protein